MEQDRALIVAKKAFHLFFRCATLAAFFSRFQKLRFFSRRNTLAVAKRSVVVFAGALQLPRHFAHRVSCSLGNAGFKAS